MIANFFNKTKPVATFSIIALLFMYCFISALSENSLLFSFPFIIKRIGFFIWLMLFLLIFKFIIKKNKLTKDNSFALLIAVLLLGTFSETISSNYIIFSNILLLLSYRKIYSLRSGINTEKKLFDAAFWIGVATLLYSWSILYLLLIYLGILMYQKASFKNLIIPIVGITTPLFIYFTYHFYNNNLVAFYSSFKYDINLDFWEYNSLKFIIPLTFLIPILVWSTINVTPKIILISNNLKYSWNVLLNHLIISMIIIVVSPIKNGSEIFYLLFPATIIITNFLQQSKSSVFKNVLLYLFLAVSISVYFL